MWECVQQPLDTDQRVAQTQGKRSLDTLRMLVICGFLVSKRTVRLGSPRKPQDAEDLAAESQEAGRLYQQLLCDGRKGYAGEVGGSDFSPSLFVV